MQNIPHLIFLWEFFTSAHFCVSGNVKTILALFTVLVFYSLIIKTENGRKRCQKIMFLREYPLALKGSIFSKSKGHKYSNREKIWRLIPVVMEGNILSFEPDFFVLTFHISYHEKSFFSVQTTFSLMSLIVFQTTKRTVFFIL